MYILHTYIIFIEKGTFINYVEFPYCCKLSCVDDFQRKHTILKSYEKKGATVLALSPPKLKDGLL